MVHRYRQINSPCETKDSCTYLAGDVKKRFDTSNYEVKRPLSIRQNKKKIGLIKK